MTRATGLVLPLLELLSDGEPHEASKVERDWIAEGVPLNITCGIGATLLWIFDQGYSTEATYDVFQITPAGLVRLSEMRAEIGAKLAMKAAPKQKAMF